MVALGLAAALLASALFNVGIALQGLEARDAPKSLGLRVGLLTRLLRRRRWLLGLALGFVGVVPQVYALSVAPFVLVQPALAAGLLLLLAIGSTHFHEPVGRWEVVGVVCIVAGIAFVAWGAPAHHDTHRSGLAILLVVGALCAGAVFPLVTRFRSAHATMLAAGFGFAAANVATKLGTDDLGSHHYPNAVAWGAVALAVGIVATLTNMTAFQNARATTVVPVVTAVETFLPIVLEPFFLHESWRILGLAPLAGGVLLALIGTILVSRSDVVSKLASAGA
jgi:drug/metabolite transporter (DMT)-like permease